MTLLSICIPTYNRANQIKELVSEILSNKGDFEVCIHIDGSTDETLKKLEELNDSRLRISYSENKGRGSALYSAISLAKGRFIMLFDDDDELYSAGLKLILSDCSEKLPDRCIGYIYHMDDENNSIIGSKFPSKISNFLKVRADDCVAGDKKEVVLAENLRQVAMDGKGIYRRIPTSLFWTRLALENNIICRNHSVGSKIYMSGGMTNSIKNLKKENTWPMTLLYMTQVIGFFYGRYRSLRYVIRATSGFFYYLLLTGIKLLKR